MDDSSKASDTSSNAPTANPMDSSSSSSKPSDTSSNAPTAANPVDSSSNSQLSDTSDNASAAAPAAAVNPDDIITLNVGGRLFSCQRRTLCLVEESLLSLMFSGRWPGGGPRDAAGNVFLDLDPDLFDIVLNWLRQFTMTSGGNIFEPEVPQGRVSHMVAMLDYLQLHRHIPLTYPENFDMQHCSAFMAVQGSRATRTALAGSHPGKHTGGARNSLMQFAVSDHPYFDMVVELSLEVLNFSDSVDPSTPPKYMFIGFMHQAAAAVLDPAGDINTQLTKSPSCYGWLVGGGRAYTVRNGHRSKEPCCKDGLLWHQGEQLVFTLDCRRERRCASISVLNTVTGLSKSLEAQPTFGGSSKGSSSSNSAGGGAGSAVAAGTAAINGARGGKKSRPGLRHRVPKFAWPGPLIWPGGGPAREEILAIIRQQPVDVNGQVAELVVGAAMQVIEAQGLSMEAAIDILGRPGLVQRLVQHVQNAVQPQMAAVQAAGAANAEQAHAAAAAPAPAPAAAAAGEASQQPADRQQQQSGSSVAAAAAGKQPDGKGDDEGHPGGVKLHGQLLPASTAEYDWVLVVGMVHPKDSVRILAAMRKGQRPGNV